MTKNPGMERKWRRAMRRKKGRSTDPLHNPSGDISASHQRGSRRGQTSSRTGRR